MSGRQSLWINAAIAFSLPAWVSAAPTSSVDWSVASQHERVDIPRERQASLRVDEQSALTLRAQGPLVLELRLRPVLARKSGKVTLRCVRDEAFASTKTLAIRGATLALAGGAVPKKPVAVQLVVPAGVHTYECRADGDTSTLLVVVQPARKAKKILAMGEEVELVPAAAPQEPVTEQPAVDTVAPVASSAQESAAAAPTPTIEVPPALLEGGPPRRTVLMPLTSSDLTKSDVALLQDQLTSALGRLKNLQVITAAEVQDLLDHEASKQQLGCASDTVCLAELGEAANADLLVSGNVGKIGDVLMLSLTVLAPKSGTVVGRAAVTAARVEELAGELGGGIARALGAVPSSKVAAFALEVPAGGVKVAVMPLRSQGLEEDVGKNLTQIVALELKNLPAFSVISQDEIAAMLQLEANKQEIGCDDASCFAELGGALGVDYLVIGTVGRLGDTFLVGLKLINTRKAEVVNRINESFKGRESDLLRAARFAVFQLVGARLETPGALAVRVTPDEPFRLELDGALVADIKQLASVSPGRHDLRVEADGYYGQYLETYVEPGLANTIALELSAIPRPWFTHWWVWAAGTGVVGGGVAAAVFLLGSDNGTSFGAVDLQLERGLTHGH